MTPMQDALAEIYAALPTINCQRKCGMYCGPVLVFPEERRRMEQAGFPVRLHVWRVTPSAENRGRAGSCSFYDPATAACRVHTVRPLICRLFGMALDSKMICPYGCQPSRWLTNHEVQRLLNRLVALDGPPQPSPVGP